MVQLCGTRVPGRRTLILTAQLPDTSLLAMTVLSCMGSIELLLITNVERRDLF
jgi:hypothetical protein